MNELDQHFHVINEPFGVGRPTSRLLFDLGIMFSCFKDDFDDQSVLDFGAGTGWISEWLNRMGYEVTAFDLTEDLPRLGQMRVNSDQRIKPDLIHFYTGDGHKMPFEANSFGHVCCFDTLHHMHNFPKALSEIYRVLIPNGRAIFVEPGAKHATSPQTLEFIEKYKKDDPTWIERSIVLDEIYQIAQECGFIRMTIRPCLLPNVREYDFSVWQEFRQGDQRLEVEYLDLLKTFNYDSRVVFYLDKGTAQIKSGLINQVKSWFKKK